MYITSKLIPFGAGILTDVFAKDNNWSSSILSSAAYSIGVEGSTFCFKTFGLEEKKCRVLAHGITAALMIGTGTASYELVVAYAITDLPFFFYQTQREQVTESVEVNDSTQELAKDTIGYLKGFLEELGVDITSHPQLNDPHLLSRTRDFISEMDPEMTPQELLEDTDLLETLMLYIESYVATPNKVTSEWFPVKRMCVQWQDLLLFEGISHNNMSYLDQATFVGTLASYLRHFALPPSISTLLRSPNLLEDLEPLLAMAETFESHFDLIKRRHTMDVYAFWDKIHQNVYKPTFMEFLKNTNDNIQAKLKKLTLEQKNALEIFLLEKTIEVIPSLSTLEGWHQPLEWILRSPSCFENFQGHFLESLNKEAAFDDYTPGEKSSLIRMYFNDLYATEGSGLEEEVTVLNFTDKHESLLEEILEELFQPPEIELDEIKDVLKTFIEEGQKLIERLKLEPYEDETLEQALARRLNECGEQIELLDLSDGGLTFLPLERLEQLTELRQLDLRGNDSLLTPLEEIQAHVPSWCNIITE